MIVFLSKHISLTKKIKLRILTRSVETLGNTVLLSETQFWLLSRVPSKNSLFGKISISNDTSSGTHKQRVRLNFGDFLSLIFYFLQFCFLAEETKYLRPDQERDRTFFIDKATGVELETVESTQFLDWLVDTDESNQPNYKQYGTTLEIVTDRSQEGAQFVKGFGGIGGELDFLFYLIKHYFFLLQVCCGIKWISPPKSMNTVMMILTWTTTD